MADAYQNFEWKGIDQNGKRVRGIIQANDLHAVEEEVRQLNIELISIKPTSALRSILNKTHLKPKDVILFSKSLSTMLSAGLTLVRALEIIASDHDNYRLSSVAASIRAKVAAGTSLSDTIQQFPDSFDDLYYYLIKAGETTATLDQILTRIVTYLEKITRLKNKIKHAMVYPAAIVTVAIIVSLILLLFVVPQFKTMYDNAHITLPYFTQLTLNLSTALRAHWFIIIIVGAGLGFLVPYLKRKNKYLTELYDRSILRIYIFGPIFKKEIMARFTRTLSITLAAGLPIVDSMRVMVNIMGNKVYSDAITKVCDALINGQSLSSSMQTSGMFPSMAVQMIVVGESSGSLPAMLDSIATYYEDEVDYIAENLSTLLEPIILVILGIIIGAFVIAMYLPIFKLGTTI